MARKEFTGGAPQVTLASSIGSTDASFSVSPAGTGYPAGTNPFVIAIDQGLITEEKILCSARAGVVFTVTTRGYDGTVPAAHSAGAYVNHVLDAGTVDEANAHVNDDTLDSHSQYLTVGRHDTTARHGSAVVDHGSIGGLADDDHAAYLNVARHDITTRHPGGTVVPTAVPAASAVGDAQALGTGTNLAGALHVHAREAWATTAELADVSFTAESTGTSPTLPHGDHGHMLPAACPRGTLAYVQVTASQSAIGAAEVDATGLTTGSLTLASGRRIKLTWGGTVVDTPAGNGVQVSLYQDASLKMRRPTVTGAAVIPPDAQGGQMSVVLTPSAGAHTFKVTYFQYGSGANTTVFASANAPAFLLVEDIGV